MKKIIISVLVLVLIILWYFFYSKNNNAKNLQTWQKKVVLTPEQKVKEYENLKKNIKIRSDKEEKIIANMENKIENKNNIVTKWKNSSNSKSKSLREILDSKWYNHQLDNYLKAICKNRSNIDDITCSAEYRFFVPKLYGFLLDMKKNEKLTYQQVQNVMMSAILRNCKKLDSTWIELLERGIKEDDLTCTKELVNIFKNYEKQLNNDSIYSLEPKKFYKPISIYYSIPSDLTDKYQYKLQTIIFSKYKKLLDRNNVSKEEFSKKLLKSVNAYTLENLKENIVNEYIKLYNKYDLDSCGLSINGYSNYFVWVPIEKKAIKCIKNKWIKKRFLKDYEKIDNMLSIYSYISKVFPTEKLQAKIIFGEKGVWIANLVDIVSFLKNN